MFNKKSYSHRKYIKLMHIHNSSIRRANRADPKESNKHKTTSMKRIRKFRQRRKGNKCGDRPVRRIYYKAGPAINIDMENQA